MEGPAKQSGDAARALHLSDRAYQLQKEGFRGVVSALSDSTGGETEGISQKGIEDLAHHQVVTELLKTIPKDPVAEGQWGRCAEVNAIDKKLFAYEKATGQKITTVDQAQQVLKGSKIQNANVRGRTAKLPLVPQKRRVAFANHCLMHWA